MKIALYLFVIFFLTAKCQTNSSQCPSDASINDEGQCVCNQDAKFLQPQSLSLLEETLKTLNSNFSDITSQIPSLYQFSEGDSGAYSYIQDGGDDMYDGGNFITVSPSLVPNPVLKYSEGQIFFNKTDNNRAIPGELSTENKSTDFTYYTVKYPGLFILTANINIDEFSITGDLGADGEGEADGTILSKTIGGVSYKGFVKRVYGTESPTVNHLIIIEDNGLANHSYSTDTNDDLHVVTGLRGVKRLYYLLFATNDASSLTNEKVDDLTMERVMTTFIETINPTGIRSFNCTGECQEGCRTCLSATECLECKHPFELVNGICQYPPCNLGSYLNNQGQCQCSASYKFLEPLSREERPKLEETLNVINRNFKLLTNQIPSIYNFSEGIENTYIYSGSLDMYDEGNYLSTDKASKSYFLDYSEQTIMSDEMLGTNGNYYTAKYPYLFLIAADIDINYFNISGELGADGKGQVDGTILTQIVNRVTYKGFVKRVYGTNDPSVNHLIIIEDNGIANHTYSTNTNNDSHVVTGLKGVDRLYYLLFSTYEAGTTATKRVDDSAIEAMMSSFISILSSVQRCTGDCPDNCMTCFSADKCSQCNTISELIDGKCQYSLCEAHSDVKEQGKCECKASGKFLESAGIKSLEETLEILDDSFSLITSEVPSLFNFTEGEEGYYISEGSEFMYGSGNKLTTNLNSTESPYLNYTDKAIQHNPILGSDGSYYTAKYPGLFVLAADIDNVHNFSIEGGIRSNSYGEADGVVLTHNMDGVIYKGFVKRVFGYNGYAYPSVNHLIIIEDNGQATHNYSLDTADDQHTITGLEGVRRLYYLLFSNYEGHSKNIEKIDDVTMDTIMASFLSIISNERRCTGECSAGCMTCISADECKECEPTWELREGICYANT